MNKSKKKKYTSHEYHEGGELGPRKLFHRHTRWSLGLAHLWHGLTFLLTGFPESPVPKNKHIQNRELRRGNLVCSNPKPVSPQSILTPKINKALPDCLLTRASPRTNSSCSSSTMKLFTVLLLASLASTSLAILHVPASQFASNNHPRKASISSEDLPMEPFIFSEELISKENVVIKSTRPMSQTPEILHPVLQGDSSKSSIEEATEFTPTAAITSEGKLTKFGNKMGKDLKKAIKGILDYLKSLIPDANDVMRP
ncbi:glycosylation-dependent cell adhesion molecule 1-like [Ictidomys tridecemlineatus]|nr:glycosylation-dependent cell adhesion molecule 1-like [Ictidomys tridecemlineatus]